MAKAIKPDYALGPHTASLGLSFASGTLLPERFRQGAFIGQHGSWNRDPPSGYKVLFVPFADGKPNGPPITVLDGFLDAEGNAQEPPGGCGVGQSRRTAGGRRRGQRDLAGDAEGALSPRADRLRGSSKSRPVDARTGQEPGLPWRGVPAAAYADCAVKDA